MTAYDFKLYEHAQRYAEKGWPVFPVLITKDPYIKDWPNNATCDVGQIRTWWHNLWPQAGIAILMGARSGMFAVDIDPRHGGHLSLEALELEHGPLPETRRSRTGSGGAHYLFRYPSGRAIGNRGGVEPGIDIKSDGGYIIAPPSPHLNGQDYAWDIDGDILEAPDWLLDLIAPLSPKEEYAHQRTLPADLPPIKNPLSYGRAALRRASDHVRKTKEGKGRWGGRNNALNNETLALSRLVMMGCITRGQVEETMQLAGEESGLKADETRRTIASALGNAHEPPDMPPARIREAELHPPVVQDAIASARMTASSILAEARHGDGSTVAAAAMPLIEPVHQEPPNSEVVDDDGGGGGGGSGGGPPGGRSGDGSEDGAIVVPSTDPAQIAQFFLTEVRDSSGRLVLRRWHGQWWRYKAGAYYALEQDTFDAVIWEYIMRLWVRVVDKSGDLVLKRVATSQARVYNIERALVSLGTLIDQAAIPPVWIGGPSDMMLRDVAVCVNGILELKSGRLIDLTPELFVTNNIATPWDPEASPRPTEWMNFLDSLFGEDWHAIELLQEWFGYCISTDTSQHKLLFLVGPPRSGKGTIQRTLTALLGHDNVSSPSLSSLATPFGLQTLLSKSLATISDARLSGRADQAVIVERILSITGEDMIDIDRKYKEPVSVRLPTRVMIASNELPRLTDASGALAKRMLILELRRSFYGQEDRALEARLLEELTQILAWAVEGWRRLKERGCFLVPDSSAEAMEDFVSLSAPIQTFVQEVCTIDANEWIECARLFEAWKGWCEAANLPVGSQQVFSRNLRAAVNSVRTVRPGHLGPRKRCFSGITVQSTI